MVVSESPQLFLFFIGQNASFGPAVLSALRAPPLLLVAWQRLGALATLQTIDRFSFESHVPPSSLFSYGGPSPPPKNFFGLTNPPSVCTGPVSIHVLFMTVELPPPLKCFFFLPYLHKRPPMNLSFSPGDYPGSANLPISVYVQFFPTPSFRSLLFSRSA